MLPKSDERGHSCLVPDLRGNAFSFSPSSMMFALGLSRVAFTTLRYVPSVPSFWGVSIVNGCRTQVSECDLGDVGLCILIKGNFSERVKPGQFFPDLLPLGRIRRLHIDMGCTSWELAQLLDGKLLDGKTLDPRGS